MTVEANARNMSGFTAENAIYKTMPPYQVADVPEYQSNPKSRLVFPALPAFLCEGLCSPFGGWKNVVCQIGCKLVD